MRSILLIDHGSVRAEANHMLACMANLLQHMVGDDVLVRYAHMELAEPSIAAGFAACVRDGATDVVAFPYMLSPGKHSTRDIPRMVAEAAEDFPHVTYRVTEAFGISAQLAEVVALRAGSRHRQHRDRRRRVPLLGRRRAASATAAPRARDAWPSRIA